MTQKETDVIFSEPLMLRLDVRKGPVENATIYRPTLRRKKIFHRDTIYIGNIIFRYVLFTTYKLVLCKQYCNAVLAANRKHKSTVETIFYQTTNVVVK